MESNQLNSPQVFSHKGHGKDRELTLQSIVKQVENGTGLSYSELKEQYSEDYLFAIALKWIKRSNLCHRFRFKMCQLFRFKLCH